MITRIFVLLVGSMGLAVAEPSREEFGYEAPLALTTTTSVYRAPLTASVYQGVARSDLGDMRVFNAAGEVVPHGLIRSAAEVAKQSIALPIFPLALNANKADSDVSVYVEVEKDGAIARVKTGQAAEDDRNAYLADVTRVQQALTALTFQWSADETTGLLHNVSIESSDDLKNWRVIAQGTLAKLKHDGQVLERNRIEFQAQRAKYLRILPNSAINGASFIVTSVEGEFTANIDPPRRWLILSPSASAKPNEQIFVSDGKMPVDRARVGLQPNSVARVTVTYQTKEGEAWILAGHKTVYLLDTPGGALRDNEIHFGRGIVASRWRVTQARQSADSSRLVTALELGWVPHDLVFVARGDAPFTLAYGRRGLQPVDFGIDELLSHSKRGDDQRVEVGQATIGPSRELQGTKALRAHWTAGWKSWLLWVVLVLGVGSLALLAARIARQVGREVPNE